MQRSSKKRAVSSVLIVDPDPSVLVFLSGLLEGNQTRALRARNGAEALQIVSRDYVPIDLVVSNVTVDNSRGSALVARLREVRPDLDALYMSAFVEDGVIRVELAEETGASLVSSADGLLAAIRSLLNTRRKKAEEQNQRTRGAG